MMLPSEFNLSFQNYLVINFYSISSKISSKTRFFFSCHSGALAEESIDVLFIFSGSFAFAQDDALSLKKQK